MSNQFIALIVTAAVFLPIGLLIGIRLFGHNGKCIHMFPERGIGCKVCDQYYWERDAEDMRTLDERIARLEENVFPLEPTERIWIKDTA